MTPPTSASGERPFNRGAQLTLALAILLLVWPLVTTLIGYTQPTDGWTHSSNRGWYLDTNLIGRPSPLREGDRIVAISGRPVEVASPPMLPEDLKVGQTLRYTVLRDGRTLDTDVTLVRRPPVSLLRYIGHSIQRKTSDSVVTLLTLLIAAFAFVRRPGSQAARLLLLVFSYFVGAAWFGFADWSTYIYTYPPPLAFAIILDAYGWGWLFFPALIQLALVFPVRLWPMRRFPRLLPALLHGVPGLLTTAIAALVVGGRREAEIWFLPLIIGLAVGFFITLFASLVHNFRTVHDPVTRAQLLWVALGFGVGWGLSLAVALLGVLIPALTPLSQSVFNWLPVLLPLSLAIAITRYQLFEIDVIIRRTLVYGVLTGTLAIVYFSAVALLQLASRALTGGVGQQPQWAIVASTLAIAALFQPLRRRIQGIIDRRFYRRRYHAARTLERFGARLRGGVELEELTVDLLSVVHETVQPEHASLWLRTPEVRR